MRANELRAADRQPGRCHAGGAGRHQGLRGRAGIGKHPRVGAAMAKPKGAGAGVIEREDIWARSVASRLADWAGRPPGRRRVAPRRALLN